MKSNRPNPRPGQAHRRIKATLLTVLGFPAALLLVLLMQGCRQEPRETKEGLASDNAAPPAQATNPATPEPANPPPTAPATNTAAPEPANPPPSATNPPSALADTNAPPSATNPSPALVATNLPAPATNPSPALADTNAPPPPPPAGADYTIAAGDTFSGLAKSHHLTIKAISEANPGVDSLRLRIGQKIHLPAAADLAATNASPAGPDAGRLYTVRAGDWLLKIASRFGTTVNALREANGLKTDRLEVGQKLKIPAKSSSGKPAE